MDLSLGEKKAIVCGSTQGIGKAAAIELALLGANVTLLARDEEKLKSVVNELQVYSGQKHDYIVADFDHAEDLKLKIDEYVDQNVVHILVNNTGGPPAGSAIEAAPEEFVKAFSNHLICNQFLVQACVHGMKEEKYGRIINIISTSVKAPIRGLGVSNTIRGAVANWAKTLALELGPFGITVNNVLPGSTMTGRLVSMMKMRAEKTGQTEDEIRREMEAQIPLGRIGDAREIASAIAFLATPAAAYINGINLPVDGGRTPCL
ncbi:MAG TPA: SDR family oxidoreductase [Cyclobacteriaceae bacterium]|nr:SDR family oxidoreductase [Cyclobacteriaceae bacterium]